MLIKVWKENVGNSFKIHLGWYSNYASLIIFFGSYPKNIFYVDNLFSIGFSNFWI